MSTWTTPITWTAGQTVTAAQMNAETRDHLNFLKGFADLITGSSTADTGTATYLNIIRAASTEGILYGRVTGDANPRFDITAAGKHEWGDGTSTVDSNLYREASATIRTDGNLHVVGTFKMNGGTAFIEPAGYFHAVEIADPAAPGGDYGKLYFRDNGSGKTQLVAKFNTGAVQVIATQP